MLTCQLVDMYMHDSRRFMSNNRHVNMCFGVRKLCILIICNQRHRKFDEMGGGHGGSCGLRDRTKHVKKAGMD